MVTHPQRAARRRGARAVLLSVALLGLLVLAIVGLVANFRGGPPGWLSPAVGGTVVALYLLQVPAMRSARRGVLAALGRALIVLAWLAQAGIAGFVGYLVAGVPSVPGFDLRLAVAVLAGATTRGLLRLGQSWAGLPVRWRLGPATLARGTLGLGATVAVAGFGHQLKDVASVALCWVPARAFETFLGWWSTAWLAVPAVIPVWAVWLLVLGVAVTLIGRITKPIFGPDNAITAWAQDAEPVKFHVNGERAGCLSWYAWTGEPVTPWRAARLRRHERRLRDDERRALHDRIRQALSEDVPPGWTQVRLEYRAVLGHQELACWLTTSDGVERPWRVPGEQVRADLWRLREAGYEAGYGTWFAVRVDARPNGFGWLPYPDEVRPEWEHPPTRRQYAEDLRRFPIVRRLRPPWLPGARR